MARTKNRVTGIVIREDKVLLIHRFKHGDEYWVFPGGGVEDGETLEEGLRREMLEETCLELESFQEIYRASGPYEDIYIFYSCTMSSGMPQLGGPEKDAHSPNNQFILEWVDFQKIFEIADIYPRPDKDKILAFFNVI